MTTVLAALALTPGGVFAWVIVGVVAGWLAGQVMKGGGFGVIADFAVGVVGALLGGVVLSYFVQGTVSFAGSIVVAFLGACLLIAVVRTLSGRRSV